MSTLANVDVWRGDNAPNVIWEFPIGFTLGGSEFDLAIAVGSGQALLLSSVNGELAVDTDARRVTWLTTAAQTLLVPFGQIARYRLRRVFMGDRQTLAHGYLIGRGGNPADV